MKITVFTHTEQAKDFAAMLTALSRDRALLQYRLFETYDDFIQGFTQEESQAVIVARRGADGMESARNAKLLQPSVPLVWLSDDPGFGVESYRIGCAFFSSEPITESLLKLALRKCNERST